MRGSVVPAGVVVHNSQLISNLSLDGARRAIALMRRRAPGQFYVGRLHAMESAIDTTPASISRFFDAVDEGVQLEGTGRADD